MSEDEPRPRILSLALVVASGVAVLVVAPDARAAGHFLVGAGGMAESIPGGLFDGNHIVSGFDNTYAIPKLGLGAGLQVDLGFATVMNEHFFLRTSVGYGHGWWNASTIAASGEARSHHLPFEINWGYFAPSLNAAIYGAGMGELTYMTVPGSRAPGTAPSPSEFTESSRQDGVTLGVGAGAFKYLAGQYFVNAAVFRGWYLLDKIDGESSSIHQVSAVWIARASFGFRFGDTGASRSGGVLFGQCHCRYYQGESPPTSCSDPRCGPVSY